jgi:regulator of protease activity HflC (stomatin/prohibitin superfamily)
MRDYPLSTTPNPAPYSGGPGDKATDIIQAKAEAKAKKLQAKGDLAKAKAEAKALKNKSRVDVINAAANAAANTPKR